jgi:hypothetical protein
VIQVPASMSGRFERIDVGKQAMRIIGCVGILSMCLVLTGCPVRDPPPPVTPAVPVNHVAQMTAPNAV